MSNENKRLEVKNLNLLIANNKTLIKRNLNYDNR